MESPEEVAGVAVGVPVVVVAGPTVTTIGRGTRDRRGTSEGREGSNNPPTHKHTTPQTEYDKIKCTCICCLETVCMWYQCNA